FAVASPTQLVSATFALTTNRVLTLLVNGEGSVVPSPRALFYTNGALVTLTATPGSGSFFAGWASDASGTSNRFVVAMFSNKTVTANFAGAPVNLPPMIEITSPSNG